MTPEQHTDRGRFPSPVMRAIVLGAALAAFGLLIMPWQASPAGAIPTPDAYLFTAVLVIVFSAAEFGQVHFEFRRRALSISLSDLPLVMGLLLAPAWLVLVARLTGGILTMLLRRRAPSRMAFNSGLFTAEVGICAAIVSLLAPTYTPLDSDTWFAVMIGVATFNVLGMIAVFVAVKWIDDAHIGSSVVWTTLISVIASGLLCSSLGIMAASVMVMTPYGLVLLVVVFGSLLLAHRAYHLLVTRHRILGRLYDFTRSSAANSTTDDVISVLLQQATHLLHAETAVLRPATWSSALMAGEELTEPVAIPRSTRSARLREWLHSNRLRDAVLVPVRQENRVIGVLQVSNRLGEVGSFGREDVHVLQTLVAHVEVLWHNSALVDRLRHDARHDPLTGLDNRTQLLDNLATLGVAYERRSNGDAQGLAPMGNESYGLLILLDVSLYSPVNDALGQQVADLLLVHVAARLDDGLPEHVSIARAADDQFAVLVPNCRHTAEAEEWLGQVRQCLTQPLETQGMVLDATPRMGYVMLPQDGLTSDEALQNAHVALVAAKKDPRHKGVSRYNSSDSDKSLYMLALAGELRAGIAAGEITVIYQPKVSAVNQRVVGFESLARWENAKRGLVMPDEFIALAENTGQLGALTASVLEQALARTSEWMLSYPEVGISVNLSASQLLDPGLPVMIDTLLRRYRLPARVLTLEITESRLMAEPEAAHNAMLELRQLGVRLSVDDFGTGYSSLSYLQRLPLDEVKIDKSFILPLTRKEENHAIVRSIIELVHTLGLSVVAEGVETETIRDLLAADGCDVIQGFLIGRGIPADSITEWLTTWESQVDSPAAWAE